MSTDRAQVDTRGCVSKWDPCEFLLVEGTTDEKFIAKLDIKTGKSLQLKCIPLGDVLDVNEYIKEKYKNFFKDNRIDIELVKPDAKKSVLNIVDEKTSKGIETFYGLVDKDFDTPQKIQEYYDNIKNIMVTPTHDLETLLLSTDENIFNVPQNVKDSYDVALYIAYLIGIVRIRLQENKCRYRKLQDNDYEEIFATNERNLRLDDFTDLTELVNFERLVALSIEDQNRLLRVQDTIVEDIQQIEINDASDRYDIANGHDIANIMKVLCKEDIDRFVKNHNAEGHNRDVEFAIIAKYDMRNFEHTPLCKAMVKRGLTPTAIK